MLRHADLVGKSECYDEKWLKQLLYRHPEVIPVEQIEPGFGDLIPLCRELQLPLGTGRFGALDNLFVTHEGRLVLVEAKLWRNPEARRSVVAQAMDYAAAVFRMNYSELETAALKARRSDKLTTASPFEIVAAGAAGVDQAEFIDAVARNLGSGRAIIAVIGDGIREDIMQLASLLQSHAGHRFTFALVELAVYRTPDSNVRLVQPSVLAQTALIERGVVHIQRHQQSDIRVEIVAPPTPTSGSSTGRRIGIGEDEFYELIGQRDPGFPGLIKALLATAERLNIYAEMRGGLSLKHKAPEGRPLNMGSVSK